MSTGYVFRGWKTLKRLPASVRGKLRRWLVFLAEENAGELGFVEPPRDGIGYALQGSFLYEQKIVSKALWFVDF